MKMKTFDNVNSCVQFVESNTLIDRFRMVFLQNKQVMLFYMMKA